jgi:hypothetical protein
VWESQSLCILGTGVIEIDGGTDFDQIYTSFGLGIKLSLLTVVLLKEKNTV